MRIIVIGASGYLGNTIYKKLKKTVNEVYGTCFSKESNDFFKIDVLKENDIDKILSLNPDIIIWSILDKEREMQFSKIGLNYIINNIPDNTRFIYISTTVGIGKDQTEEVLPNKRNSNEYLYKYINGKIVGEDIVRKHNNHAIVRPGSIYGYDYDNKMDCRMKELLYIYKSNKEYVRTANMYTSFVDVNDLSHAVIELVYNSFTGTLNISGEKAVSYYDFYKHLAKLIKIDNSFIVPDYKSKDMYHNLENSKRKTVLKTKIHNI